MVCWKVITHIRICILEHKGTKEDFMWVFDDINLMEEVYGTDMDSMIAEWLEYLNREI